MPSPETSAVNRLITFTSRLGRPPRYNHLDRFTLFFDQSYWPGSVSSTIGLTPKNLVDNRFAALYTPKYLGGRPMASKRTERLTPLELEIMNILWETGAANVHTVQERLDRELAYTTVQTMLNILHRKGRVKRTLKDRAYVYKPAVTRTQVI